MAELGEGAGREIYVPPLQGHGLADTQPGPPHDERRHPGAAKPQGRQGIQEPLDLLGVPVVRNHMGKLTPLSKPQREPAAGAPELASRSEMGTFRLKVPSSHPPAPYARFSPAT